MGAAAGLPIIGLACAFSWRAAHQSLARMDYGALRSLVQTIWICRPLLDLVPPCRKEMAELSGWRAVGILKRGAA